MTQNGPPKKDSEFLPNSAIETQKTQKLGVFAEILPPVEALLPAAVILRPQQGGLLPQKVFQRRDVSL